MRDVDRRWLKLVRWPGETGCALFMRLGYGVYGCINAKSRAGRQAPK